MKKTHAGTCMTVLIKNYCLMIFVGRKLAPLCTWRSLTISTSYFYRRRAVASQPTQRKPTSSMVPLSSLSAQGTLELPSKLVNANHTWGEIPKYTYTSFEARPCKISAYISLFSFLFFLAASVSSHTTALCATEWLREASRLTCPSSPPRLWKVFRRSECWTWAQQEQRNLSRIRRRREKPSVSPMSAVS